jgi:hypothetical protein
MKLNACMYLTASLITAPNWQGKMSFGALNEFVTSIVHISQQTQLHHLDLRLVAVSETYIYVEAFG